MSDTDRSATVKVLLLNDDETTMEFVVDVLERVFGKTRDEAGDHDRPRWKGRMRSLHGGTRVKTRDTSNRAGQTQWLSSALCHRAQLELVRWVSLTEPQSDDGFGVHITRPAADFDRRKCRVDASMGKAT